MICHGPNVKSKGLKGNTDLSTVLKVIANLLTREEQMEGSVLCDTWKLLMRMVWQHMSS